MIDINDLSKLGFGCYRISGTDTHKKAITEAFNNGCNLFDTASNYKKGFSQKFLGEILKNKDAFIVSKAGYAKNNDIKDFNNDFISQNTSFIGPDFYHSIHPDFLKLKLEESLISLDRDYLDVFLLHNPEYYFKDTNQDKELDKSILYNQISESFEFLEECVSQGKIRYYGVSSNSLPSHPDADNHIDLRELVKIAKKNSNNSNFRFIQFPYNLIEDNAIRPQYEGKSLVQIAKENNIKTIGNRPLNANTESGPLRLASYPDAHKNLNIKVDKKIILEIIENVISEEQASQINSLFENKEQDDVTIYNFAYKKIRPIILRPPKDIELNIEARLLNNFHDIMNNYFKASCSAREKEIKNSYFKDQNSDASLQELVLKRYLKNIDHVLMGLTNPEYITSVKPFFSKK